MSFLCKVKGHQPDRGGARHDGQDYWTACKRCLTPLIRDQDGWRSPTEAEIVEHAGHAAQRSGLVGDAGLAADDRTN